MRIAFDENLFVLLVRSEEDFPLILHIPILVTVKIYKPFATLFRVFGHRIIFEFGSTQITKTLLGKLRERSLFMEERRRAGKKRGGTGIFDLSERGGMLFFSAKGGGAIFIETITITVAF